MTLRAASHPGSSAKKVPVPEMLGNHTLPKESLEVFHLNKFLLSISDQTEMM